MKKVFTNIIKTNCFNKSRFKFNNDFNNNILKSFFTKKSFNTSVHIDSSVGISETKLLNKSYPFQGFYLNEEDALILNDLDRSLLLFKSNSVIQKEVKAFLLQFLSDMSKIKKLFPYLTGINVFLDYFKKNLNDFDFKEIAFCIKNYENLKIFSYNNSNSEILLSNDEIQEIEIHKNIQSDSMINDLSDKVLTELNKNEYDILEIIKILDYFSLSGFRDDKFWKEISLINIIDQLENKKLSKKHEILALVQFIYNISFSYPKYFSVQNSNSLKILNKIFTYMTDRFEEVIFEKRSELNNELVFEIPRILESIFLINQTMNDEAFKFLQKNYIDKLNQLVEKGPNKSLDYILFIVCFKYLENQVILNKEVNDEKFLYFLSRINYKELNSKEKVLFNFLIFSFKTMLNEKNELLELYTRKLNLNDTSEEIDNSIIKEYFNFHANRDKNQKEKIYYDIKFFDKNKQKLSLARINIRNSFLSFN